MPHANYLDDIRPTLAAIAAKLGATVDPKTDKAMGRLTLTLGVFPVTLFVNQAWNGKASISIDNAEIPAKAWNQYHKEKTPSIGVDLTRDPDKLASDIVRRLLDPSRMAIQANYDSAMRWLKGKQDRAAFADELATEFPDMIRKREWDDAIHFTASGKGIHLTGGLDTGDSLRLAHGSIHGQEMIRLFLRFLQTHNAG